MATFWYSFCTLPSCASMRPSVSTSTITVGNGICRREMATNMPSAMAIANSSSCAEESVAALSTWRRCARTRRAFSATSTASARRSCAMAFTGRTESSTSDSCADSVRRRAVWLRPALRAMRTSTPQTPTTRTPAQSPATVARHEMATATVA